jgi:KUP system potassium uptake protein
LPPAFSVWSAVDVFNLVAPDVAPFLLPHTVIILVDFFAVLAPGTARVSALFGPITTVWFLVLAVIGAIHIFDDPTVL